MCQVIVDSSVLMGLVHSIHGFMRNAKAVNVIFCMYPVWTMRAGQGCSWFVGGDVLGRISADNWVCWSFCEVVSFADVLV